MNITILYKLCQYKTDSSEDGSRRSEVGGQTKLLDRINRIYMIIFLAELAGVIISLREGLQATGALSSVALASGIHLTPYTL
jgi:hypothetical protein